jgi:hypothetical protein
MDTIVTAIGNKTVEIYFRELDILVMESSDGSVTYFQPDAGTSGTSFSGTWTAYRQVMGNAVYTINQDQENRFSLVFSSTADAVTVTVEAPGTPVYSVEMLPPIIGTWYYKDEQYDETLEYWYTFNEDNTYEIVEMYTMDQGIDTFATTGSYFIEGSTIEMTTRWNENDRYRFSVSGQSLTLSEIEGDTLTRASGTRTTITGTWTQQDEWSSVSVTFSPGGSLTYTVTFDDQTGPSTITFTGTWIASGNQLTLTINCPLELQLEQECMPGETETVNMQYSVTATSLIFFQVIQLTRSATKPEVSQPYLFKRPRSNSVPFFRLN